MSNSESKRLEKTRVALTNAQTHTQIKPILAEYGIDEVKIAEGLDIYNNALQKWELNKQENLESKVAKTEYYKIFDEVERRYKKHKTFAQRFFHRSPTTLIKLGLEGSYPTKYDEIFSKIKHFYTTISTDEAIQTDFAKIKITAEIVADSLAKFDQLLVARANYDKELGESQDATGVKNEALTIMEEWMADFDAIATIALYDKPQLLEVLGIFVRN